MNNPDRSGKDSRKQAVSIRMSRSDVRHIKRLAERLGARDSDVIRFAIKLMLHRLAPLQDPAVHGRNLVPVFLEAGPELMRHFELDSARLSSIINDEVSPAERVEPDDIQLIAMSGIQRSFVKLRMPMLRRVSGVDAGASNKGDSDGTGHVANGHRGPDQDSPEQSLRQYLYDKYLYGRASGEANHSSGGS